MNQFLHPVTNVSSCWKFEQFERAYMNSHTNNGDWKLVIHRRRRTRAITPSTNTKFENQPWSPSNVDTDPLNQSKLMRKMESTISNLKSSQFFATLLLQIQSPPLLDRFRKTLAKENEMSMVIYGIGSIESSDRSRLQLSLAILLKMELPWIGDIEVFDPVLSVTDCKVLEDLNCRVLGVNENGRREASKPMMFFMPYCEAGLYDNLLGANWKVELLNRVVIFGNSFEKYEEASGFKNSIVSLAGKHILAARKFVFECPIDGISDEYFTAFHDSSWHFFSASFDSELGALHS